MAADSDPIDALIPEGTGHQFVVYGDSCSGVPGAPKKGGPLDASSCGPDLAAGSFVARSAG